MPLLLLVKRSELKAQHILFFIMMTTLLFCGCSISFKGISIPPDVNTFYVENFRNAVSQAPADINQRFSEALRAKIRNESRLTYNEQKPDVEFSGEISGFRLFDEAPQAGNTVALNKLEITVSVAFANNKDETKNWKKSFSFFRTFESDKDFVSIQDNLIAEIFKQLTENIFNESFTGW